MKKYPKKIVYFLGLVILLGLILTFFIFYNQVKKEKEDFLLEEKVEKKHYPTPKRDPLPPPPISILKKRGCVADGILYGYGGNIDNAIKLVSRSGCQYLHRAVETWLSPPDFWEIAQRKDQLNNKNLIYSMFIAEAIDKKSEYYYLTEDREFDFSKMCRPGSDNFWGEHTCKPSFQRKEYRLYLRYITEQAIDQGIQVFLFGQIFYQESAGLNPPIAKDIIEEMKEYAAFKGTSILVGAQTNNIENENYLRLFDFIEGGVGISQEGNIESGPCFSRWWNAKEGGWCWALLWNKKYSQKANNVILHLDWSAKVGDDMSIFSRMSREKRSETLENLYTFFTSKDFGFLLPIITPLPKENDGCYGDKKRYYTADNKYSCQDEETIKNIFNNK